MSNIIGGLAPRGTVSDAMNSGYELLTAFGVYTLAVGQRTFVYVAGLHDDGISVFELGSDGSLTSVENIRENASLELNDVANFTSATVSGVTYLYSVAEQDDGISVFRVNANGTLTSVQNITDTSALELNGSEGRPTVVTVGSSQFLLATGDDDNGVSVFRIGSDGTLTNTFNITDNTTLKLDNAMDAVAATVDGHTFVCVAGEDDNGLAVLELDATGRLTSTQNISDNSTLNLWGATGLAVVVQNSVTYVIASGCYDNGLSVFSLSGAGQLTNVFNINDTAARGLAGAQGLTPFTLGGETFLAVSGRDDDAISIFEVGSGGTLTDVTAIFDDAGLRLDGNRYNAFATAGGKAFLIGTGFNDNGVSVLEIMPPGSTPTNVSPTDITVSGGTVQENAAGGTVVATLGAVDPDAGDTFTFDIGGDSAPFVIVGNQIRVASGAVLDYESKNSYTVALSVTDSANHTYSENLTIGVQDVAEGTNPPIIGTSVAETLTGTSGEDEIWGRSGGDILLGLAGNDILYGEAGNDTLDGGLGADTLVGGLGGDTFQVDDAGDTITELAGEGTDTVRTTLSSYSLNTAGNANIEILNYSGPNPFTGTGNALNNTLLGGNYNDTLYGLGGNDLIKGLNGADILTGGAGADDFVYMAISNSKIGTGMDHILDFAAGEDDLVVTNIDANTAVSGDQAFVLDADGSFSVGEIRQRVDGSNLILEFNVDADATVEMVLLIQARTTAFIASDFEL